MSVNSETTALFLLVAMPICGHEKDDADLCHGGARRGAAIRDCFARPWAGASPPPRGRARENG